MIRGLDLLLPHPDFPRGERSWRLNPSPMANDFIKHAYVNEKGQGSESLRGW